MSVSFMWRALILIYDFFFALLKSDDEVIQVIRQTMCDVDSNNRYIAHTNMVQIK